ncbi:1,4-alpha-glucan-branching enzyme 1, chloroplastic/amyloplastic [Vitis vinifera]|uniref:1,4-alpha-glucan-branching enzyme 1, chloroplastic/amyloplastic n=1 Tax=Vitis vinifera TaxID=29760 RepID=A0A438EJW0_VITVI|nr:1,4-alpha-glucan-branching enzyme 1, chloroplastic/amyloplastic [Vitis vinifera]
MVYTLSGIRLPVVSSANNRSVLSISSGRRTANLSLFSKKSSFSREDCDSQDERFLTVKPTDKKRKNPSGWTGVIYVRDMRNVKPPSSLLQYRDEAMSIGVSLYEGMKSCILVFDVVHLEVRNKCILEVLYPFEEGNGKFCLWNWPDHGIEGAKSPLGGKIFAGKSSYDSDSSSLRVAASDKTLVPGSQIDGSSSSTGQIEVPDTVLEDPQVLQDVDDLTMEYDNDINKPTNDCSKVDENQDSVHSDLIDNDDKVQGAEKAITLPGTGTIKKEEARPKSIPPPGTGQRIYEIDPFLRGYREHLDYR